MWAMASRKPDTVELCSVFISHHQCGCLKPQALMQAGGDLHPGSWLNWVRVSKKRYNAFKPFSSPMVDWQVKSHTSAKSHTFCCIPSSAWSWTEPPSHLGAHCQSCVLQWALCLMQHLLRASVGWPCCFPNLNPVLCAPSAVHTLLWWCSSSSHPGAGVWLGGDISTHLGGAIYECRWTSYQLRKFVGCS